MRRNIFIFNPETDYALALGRKIYNPPARIAHLRDEMQLIPAHIALPGDAIVVADDFNISQYHHASTVELVRQKGLITLTPSELPDFINRAPSDTLRILPWGWNHTLRHNLTECGIPGGLLKSIEEIDALRSLSHRRTTIPLLESIQSRLPHLNVTLPKEFFSADEALDFFMKERDVYFKAPWSSSGRGVLHTSLSSDVKLGKLGEWLGGFIRKQGSVMGERAFDRAADFASEWMISSGKALFKGLSYFRTSPDGRYLANERLSQSEIDELLGKLSPHWNKNVINAQKIALESVVAPGYSGPAGIDMLISSDGLLNPCVEINLRFTMGMIALGQSFLI